MNNSKVYIIIVNYNNWEDTIECMESLLQSNYKDFQIIVVDNKSENNSMEYIKLWADGLLQSPSNKNFEIERVINMPVQKPVKYSFYFENELNDKNILDLKKDYNVCLILIQANENKGFAAGNNIGIRYSLLKNDFDSIILLNNDTVVHSDAISKIIEAKQNYGDKAIYGGRIFYYEKPDIIWYDGGCFNEWLGRSIHINLGKKVKYSNELKEVSFVTFCYVLIPKYIIEKVGLLDESYFMYVEDLDYSYKIMKSGYQLYQVRDSVIWHKIGSSTGNSISEMSSYFYYRNSLIFRMRYTERIKRLFAILYYFIRLPYVILKWLLIKPTICKSVYKGIRDAFFCK